MDSVKVYAELAENPPDAGEPGTYALLAVAAAISELAAAVTATGIMWADLAEAAEREGGQEGGK